MRQCWRIIHILRRIFDREEKLLKLKAPLSGLLLVLVCGDRVSFFLKEFHVI